MKKLTCGFVLALVIGIFFAVSAVAEFYVIPVNNKCGPCEGTRSAGGRWCDNGDGTVTDMTTCLVWLKYASWGGAKPWRSGETDCSSPDYVCYDDARYRVSILKDNDLIKSTGESVYLDDTSERGDWRLPTKTELVGITTGDEYVRSCENCMQLFEGVQPEYYWSSTTYASDIFAAWFLDMADGSVLNGNKDNNYYVWPVRRSND